jgi:phosphoribosyl 1,2-cyclic phosphodiesterase
MKIKFWGVRGSIATPGPKTVRYGGNTTCIEVRADDGTLIILDAGTGIFPLAQSLLGSMPLTANIFLTHTHWDHIQGLPFFIPIFVPGNTLRLHGAYDPVTSQGIEQAMTVQLQYSYFPVREAELRAKMEYVTLAPDQPIHVGPSDGGATVTPCLLNHPVIDFGYRIECRGANGETKSVFFTGDHEPPYNIYLPGDPEYAEYQSFVDERDAAIVKAMQGLDVLIADTSYTVAEYNNPTSSKVGWGHGTYATSFDYATRAGVKVLYCTHHEPTRSDDALEVVFKQALEEHPHPQGLDIRLAMEGQEFEF